MKEPKKCIETEASVDIGFLDQSYAVHLQDEMIKHLSYKLLDYLSPKRDLIIKVSDVESVTDMDYGRVIYSQRIELEHLVRCKYCIHRDTLICPFSAWHAQKFADRMEHSIKSNVEDSDYCFIGERKDG